MLSGGILDILHSSAGLAVSGPHFIDVAFVVATRVHDVPSGRTPFSAGRWEPSGAVAFKIFLFKLGQESFEEIHVFVGLGSFNY